jgi:MFS family permease
MAKKKSLSISGKILDIQKVIDEFPRQFWVLVAAAFIDRLGGAMIFPFFTLYMTERFGIGMTQVGILFAIFSITSVTGSMIGGALTDRLGRKRIMIFGLVMSALSALLMGLIGEYWLFIIVIPIVGMLADSGFPAQQARVADLLPEEKRAEGFGILRVVFNLAVVIGPLIGGLIASQSYLLLFIIDAIASLTTALIVYFSLQETWRPQEKGQAPQSMARTFAGYGAALRDTAFVWFMVASALMVLVYMQMNTTLAVYLRDNHDVSVQGFSIILSLNAAMVVLFQFWTTRRVERYRPLMVMAAGTLLYAIGFAMYGFVNSFFMFLSAMVIITIGEMMVSPVGQAIVARLAPEEMRGRYMAVYGFSWIIPSAIGPLLAGMVLDNLNPDWLWYLSGIIGLIGAAAFFGLEELVSRASWANVDRRLQIIEQLETNEIDAQQAAQKLEALDESPWVRLAPAAPPDQQRHLRIKVSEQDSGAMKTDLRLPMGLINTVVYVGGQFSSAFDRSRNEEIKELLYRSDPQDGPQKMDTAGEHVEVHLD